MPDPTPDDPTPDDLAAAVAAALDGRAIGVAESLTGGLLANALAQAEGSSGWFRGAVVAYVSEVKHDLLAVRPGPVVAEQAAVAMAESAARLLGADVGVAVTGAGGPDPQDGQPPGTVWAAVTAGGETSAWLHRFDGGPSEVCRQSVVVALGHVVEHLAAA